MSGIAAGGLRPESAARSPGGCVPAPRDAARGGAFRPCGGPTRPAGAATGRRRRLRALARAGRRGRRHPGGGERRRCSVAGVWRQLGKSGTVGVEQGVWGRYTAPVKVFGGGAKPQQRFGRVPLLRGQESGEPGGGAAHEHNHTCCRRVQGASVPDFEAGPGSGADAADDVEGGHSRRLVDREKPTGAGGPLRCHGGAGRHAQPAGVGPWARPAPVLHPVVLSSHYKVVSTTQFNSTCSVDRT